MSVLINYGPNQSTAEISADCQLTEISFAVESVINYFLGRGVSRFDCTRTSKSGNCILIFRALQKPGPMSISGVCSIKNAVEQNFLPRNISDSDNFQLDEPGFEKVVFDGQHKHCGLIIGRKKTENNTTSVIEYGVNPEFQLSFLSYGLADMFTGLFVLKCNYLKWQVSLNKIQLYILHNLNEKNLMEFLLSPTDYDVNQKVSDLPR